MATKGTREGFFPSSQQRGSPHLTLCTSSAPYLLLHRIRVTDSDSAAPGSTVPCSFLTPALLCLGNALSNSVDCRPRDVGILLDRHLGDVLNGS